MSYGCYQYGERGYMLKVVIIWDYMSYSYYQYREETTVVLATKALQ